MFKRIIIELAGPICDCRNQDLGWGVYKDTEGKSTLSINCKTCKTEHLVPHDKFLAWFSLEKGYPDGVKPVVKDPNDMAPVPPPPPLNNDTLGPRVAKPKSGRDPLPVTHSKEFTLFDEKFLKQWGIAHDPPAGK